MTENEWLRSTDPESMLLYLEAPRKEQLICVACLRRIEYLLTDDGCRGAIAAIERNVDSPMEYDEFMTAYYAAYGGWDRMASAAADGNYTTPLLRAMSDAGLAAWHAIDGDYQCVGEVANAVACFAAPSDSEKWIAARQIESAAQADIIREIVGNPFCSVAFDPTWRTTETYLVGTKRLRKSRFQCHATVSHRVGFGRLHRCCDTSTLSASS